MKHLPEATAVEGIAGSPITEGALTIAAALAGGLVAPLLPVLAKSLASERQRKRIESFLTHASTMLSAHEGQLRSLSDAQYKLVNESILAAFQTTQAEKLDLLQRAVGNALSMAEIEPMEAIALSRTVRDISVEEAEFLVRNFQYEYVHVTNSAPSENDPKTLYIHPGSREELLIGGLVSLGLLTTGQPTLGQLLRFSRLVPKLIVLFKGKGGGCDA
jgi:hypothetical protein